MCFGPCIKAAGKRPYLTVGGCHTIPDVALPESEFEPPFILEIGGKVYRVRNYGELLTSVVNPDHINSRKYIVLPEQADRDVVLSPMPYYGGEMTVAELIDLIAFLRAQYIKLQPDYYRSHYRSHYRIR